MFNCMELQQTAVRSIFGRWPLLTLRPDCISLSVYSQNTTDGSSESINALSAACSISSCAWPLLYGVGHAFKVHLLQQLLHIFQASLELLPASAGVSTYLAVTATVTSCFHPHKGGQRSTGRIQGVCLILSASLSSCMAQTEQVKSQYTNRTPCSEPAASSGWTRPAPQNLHYACWAQLEIMF